MAKDSSGAAGDALNRLSAAIRELQAQVTEDVLNLRARLLAVEQGLEEIRREAKGQPGEKEAPPATKAGTRSATKRAPETAAKTGRRTAAAKTAKVSRSKS
jgi:hypothetical protein